MKPGAHPRWVSGSNKSCLKNSLLDNPYVTTNKHYSSNYVIINYSKRDFGARNSFIASTIGPFVHSHVYSSQVVAMCEYISITRTGIKL